MRSAASSHAAVALQDRPIERAAGRVASTTKSTRATRIALILALTIGCRTVAPAAASPQGEGPDAAVDGLGPQPDGVAGPDALDVDSLVDAPGAEGDSGTDGAARQDDAGAVIGDAGPDALPSCAVAGDYATCTMPSSTDCPVGECAGGVCYVKPNVTCQTVVGSKWCLGVCTAAGKCLPTGACT